MAKRYEFWYNVEEAWKASFVADSLEHAEQLLAKAEEEGNFADVLPGFWEKNKGLDTVIDMPSLEFLGEFDEEEEDK